MIYLELLWGFLRVGLFAFGGAYGAIPLIRDIVLENGWLSEEMFIHLVAVSESTPGPIMVNMATYIGSSQAGLLGAITATVAVVIPSFFIILLIVSIMKNFINNKNTQAVLRGIKPCFVGIILASGVSMIFTNSLDAIQVPIDFRAPLITLILLMVTFGYQKIGKKDFSPILLIFVSAGLGIATYAFPF